MSGTSWPATAPTVRRPRWRVLVGGTPLVGCESVEIHQTNHRKASTVSAIFALDADPAMAETWCDSAPPIGFEVQAAFLQPGAPEASGPWQSVFTGEFDGIHVDLIQGTVETTGRDLSGRLIDGKTRETFANLTGSEIAQTVAGRFGMTADVDATSVLAGTFYQAEHDKITLDSFSKTTSYWDLILFLARNDGRDLWVDGTVLHYKKPVGLTSVTPLGLVYDPRGQGVPYPSIPVTDIQLDRNLVLARGVKVIVKIWNSKQKSAIQITYPPTSQADAQEFVYVRPGMSPQAALTFAQSMYADIIKHTRTVSISLPGELLMTPRSVVQLSGAPGNSFNTRYFVDDLTREFSISAGFTQHASLQNHSPQSGESGDSQAA